MSVFSAPIRRGNLPQPQPAQTVGRWAVYRLGSLWLVVPVGHARFYGRKDSALRHARRLDTDDRTLSR